MAFLPQLKPEKLKRIVEKRGFVCIRQSGSHAILKHADGRWTTIPMHRKTVGKGLLRKILRDIQISPDELRELV